MRLPLRHGVFGLRNTTRTEADAALLSGAAMAQSSLAEGSAACQPFRGLMRISLMEAWHRVFETVREECGWRPPLRGLPANFVKETLPTVQQVVLRTLGDR